MSEDIATITTRPISRGKSTWYYPFGFYDRLVVDGGSMMSIMIVDDSEDVRLLIKTMLNSAGYTDLDTAESAHDLFRRLGIEERESKNMRVEKTAAVHGRTGEDIDLILLDIILPDIDGIEVCRKIKNDNHFKDTPILMVSSKSMSEDLEQAFLAGAIDFIHKPFDRVELISRVKSALRLKNEIDARKARERDLLVLTKELEKTNEQLQDLTHIDALTGIANRRHFDTHVDLEWKRAIRDKTNMSIIMIDIDFFKDYNDTYGHPEGDKCLQKIAHTLSINLHRPGDYLARYGGEEFVVLLTETDAKGAEIIAEALRASVEHLEIIHSGSRTGDFVTISLGVASTVPWQNSNYRDLLNLADAALYEAKREGRNRVKITTSTNF